MINNYFAYLNYIKVFEKHKYIKRSTRLKELLLYIIIYIYIYIIYYCET